MQYKVISLQNAYKDQFLKNIVHQNTYCPIGANTYCPIGANIPRRSSIYSRNKKYISDEISTLRGIGFSDYS